MKTEIAADAALSCFIKLLKPVPVTKIASPISAAEGVIFVTVMGVSVDFSHDVRKVDRIMAADHTRI